MAVFAVGLNDTWCFSHLLLLRPEEMRSCILRHVQQNASLCDVAAAYIGSEDSMDVPTLELLLDALETLLDQVATGQSLQNSYPLCRPLRLLCGMYHPHDALVSTPLDDATMAPAFESLASHEPKIGAILAVGLGQRADKVDQLCDLLERVPAESGTAQESEEH